MQLMELRNASTGMPGKEGGSKESQRYRDPEPQVEHVGVKTELIRFCLACWLVARMLTRGYGSRGREEPVEAIDELDVAKAASAALALACSTY